MKPEDQAAFDEWYATRRIIRSVIQPGEEWQAALAHRNAQASVINEQLLNALKMVLDDPESLDGRPRTAECVMEAIAAAEAHKGAA